jgi:adenosylmethionine-8-amino-7-oxononanoate aminotransferase
MNSIGKIYGNKPSEKFVIDPPYVKELNMQSATEPEKLQKQKQREEKSLALIEKKLRDTNLDIGAVWIETIVGHYKCLLFFRKEFLCNLRKLCDKYNVPIFCDEILTCGGRTGKPLAYQHYAGFEPDYFSFGKGLLVSGVAAVHRDFFETFDASFTTNQVFIIPTFTSFNLLHTQKKINIYTFT